jgi:hypothetical protein
MMAETSSAAALEALETIKGTVPAELHASLDECRALYESKCVRPATRRVVSLVDAAPLAAPQ